MTTVELTYETVLAAALSVPSNERSMKHVAITLGTTQEKLRSFFDSLPKDSKMHLKGSFIRTGTKRVGGGGKREPVPSKPDVAMQIATDPGGCTKEDLYRVGMLLKCETENWLMHRAIKRWRGMEAG